MLLSENGKYPKERTPEIVKIKKIWFHDMFFNIYHTYREKNAFRKNGNYSKI